MINFNGDILDESQVKFGVENRSFKYGDSVFESMKYSKGKIHFWEDHYFRLMSSMRILRMEIPMNFSPEYLEEQIIEVIESNHFEQNACRVRLSVYRKGGGAYLPKTKDVEFVINAERLPNDLYELNEEGLVLDLYKDHFKQASLLSNIKSANAILFVLASIYKQENRLDECVLLNDQKEVTEAISSNLFLIKDKVFYTPPTETGCLKGVMRKNVIALIKEKGFELKEEPFSPFELQRGDELFLTNAIKGIQWVGKYRKKSYGNDLTKEFSIALNHKVNN